MGYSRALRYNRSVRIFTYLFLTISILVFLTHYFLIGQAVYGDGRFYYSYARSLALQGSLDIKDELTHTFSPQDNNIPQRTSEQFTGYPVQSLGPALFWAPIINITHRIAQRVNLLSNGYSDIYQISVGIFSIVLASLAFHRLGNHLLKTLRPAIVFTTLLLLWAGTNLFFYTAIDNINTHFFSFSLSAIALCEYLDKKSPSLIFTGLLAGLALQNRQLDILFHLGIFAAYFSANRKITDLFKFSVMALISLLPQLYVWQFQFGSFMPPMAGQGFWSFSPRSLIDIFFALPQGLLFTAPVVMIALLYMLLRPKDKFTLYSSISFLIFILLISSWWSPMGGAAYGPRFLITFYPLLAIVLGNTLKHAPSSHLAIFSTIFISLSLLQTFIFLYVSP